MNTLEYRITDDSADNAVKEQILKLLHDAPLTNAEIRGMSQLGRKQVIGLMKAFEAEGKVRLEARGRASRWHLVE